jgi:16S rRNA (guanine966-N2)-methyltransferase
MKRRGAVTKEKPSQLRIIGGEWRGRKLSFHARPGLRPTSDRVRETLFNWLAPTIVGADCLDLFSGSGALGLEALSRGANYCDFVESDQLAAASIQGNLRLLGDNSPRGRVTATDALKFMDAAQRHWDVVFVDPPFDLGIGTSALEYLASHDCLSHDSWIYFETRRSAPEAVPDSLYTLHREKTAGDVLYRLLTPKAQQ